MKVYDTPDIRNVALIGTATPERPPSPPRCSSWPVP
jgi:hypothetical protein